MKPKVTIIIPVFNAERFVEKCIESVVSQTFKSIEVIIINDASTDNSWSLIKNYADNDKRINLISLTGNKGQGFCRNIGIKRAKGEKKWFVSYHKESEKEEKKENLSSLGIDKTTISLTKITDI